MQQLKVTTTIGGEDHVNTITVPKSVLLAGQTAEQVAAFDTNSAMLHAVGGAINLAGQNKIEKVTVEVVG